MTPFQLRRTPPSDQRRIITAANKLHHLRQAAGDSKEPMTPNAARTCKCTSIITRRFDDAR
jgi:hypothetical protein